MEELGGGVRTNIFHQPQSLSYGHTLMTGLVLTAGFFSAPIVGYAVNLGVEKVIRKIGENIFGEKEQKKE